jgi:tetratricopeptide (TPR) repeat protein
MMKKIFILFLLIIFSGSTLAFATAENSAAIKKSDPILLTNQLMLVFMEHMKHENYKEAREVAQEMIYEHKKFKDTAAYEYKSFHSVMEKELYQILQAKKGERKEVRWLQQPISDGFYLLAVLDFQEGNHDKALDTLQKAIQWNPVRSAFFSERGFMLLRKDSGPDLLMSRIAYEKALELAETGEDFAAALRGLAFIFVEQGRLADGLACLLVSKEFDSTNLDAEEEIAFIRRANPALFAIMNVAKAKEQLRKIGIQTTYSPVHIQVLMRVANNFATAKSADRAIMLLRKASDMAPENLEVQRRLKQLKKGRR